ncbi:enoyl-CoA hydratase/isomerase family protein [Sphingobium sp.]|uniref:enoyl-CoA hydratase/isomerase family protein n=1 Tax=Sphingobium sp. TaxID=1912891 RepID=UPI002C5BF38B|nr:enoyl-CoA hydratase/isomerase family protein [Sphingobium sp.]HUD92703.1 enoyl-CoA hydratase/isomerase family protein [Sphingobium sp.]
MTMTHIGIDGAIGVIRLDRPKVLNAMNESMVEEIERALDRFEADGAVRAVVITGTGRAFCVGSDLKEGGCDPDRRIARMHRLILRLDAYPKVSVAAFNGLALGGGLEIGMACTLRVAVPDARLGLPEVTHALMPAYGGTQLLPRLIGVGRALQMALTGEMIDAARAEQIGLVNMVAPDAQEVAVALADHCTRSGGVAPREIRRAILGGIGLPLPQGLALEAQGAARVAASAEAKAAVVAFASGH